MMLYGSRADCAVRHSMTRNAPSLILASAAALLLAALPAAAHATARIAATGPHLAFEPGEVVVRYEDGRERVRRTRDGESTLEATERLARRRNVRHANPNWLARASAFIPNDPGRGDTPGGWRDVQWNFMPGTGVDAPTAWQNLIDAGRPGGAGVTVAVLDTGVAYSDRGRFRRSPDLAGTRFRQGYDFVGRDPYANDTNGHGTHVASTIAEATNNGVALTGLAYGARIMPVRVLDRYGFGRSSDIAKGIRFAARRGAKIINLSFEFGVRGPTRVRARDIPGIMSALRYARRRGALVVGASGNESARALAYPARANRVLSVGATTEHACQAEYSNRGSRLDLVAPGGGLDASIDDPQCRADDPDAAAPRDIIQMTFLRSVKKFGLPRGYMGTSMAAPHVSATAALIVASGVIGRNPSPRKLINHLKATATDLGKPGPDARYGHGLINAGRATTPTPTPTPTPAADPTPAPQR